MSTEEKKTTIALLGQPNSGKSTLFNALTGLRQHVGNWPGKTVEKKEGTFTHGGKEYVAADLPGSYSLSANSAEEIITRDFISSGKADAVCILADASQLERSLFMLADYVGIRVPCFLLLNMADVAKEQGKKIDAKAIEAKLGIPVLLFSAADTKEYDAFYPVMERALREKTVVDSAALEKRLEEISGFAEIRSLVPDSVQPGYSSAWMAAKALEGDKVVLAKLRNVLSDADAARIDKLRGGTNGAVATGEAKFAWIDELLSGAVSETKSKAALGKLDRIFTHRFWGKPAVVLTVLLGLIASFIPALPLMGVGEGIKAIGNALGGVLENTGCPDILTAIIRDVIFVSLGNIFAMLGFVFGVTLVFSILEEVGIMARVSYVFDNTMGKLGLQGKSVMPFLVSFGCTMGGAAGARVIDNWGQKVLTIALAWAVPCGAAWAIIPLVSTWFFGAGAVLLIAVILLMMLLHMWLTAKVFGHGLVKQEDRYGMIMELPPYHKPKWSGIFKYVLGRTRDTFFRVTKVVLLICAVFWLLSYAPTSVESSVLYKVGVAIEPVTKFFGLPWQLFMAFIASSVGKEGAVGVLSALFAGTSSVYAATNGAAQAANMSEILLANVTKPEALAFIFAITFNVPCVVAVAATYQEIHSVKWTLRIAAYYTVTALLLALIAYRIGLLIW